MNRIGCIAAGLALLMSPPTHAGLYSDDLARCLVAGSSEADKTDLIRWLFAISALHPDVKSIATVSAKERAGMNKATAALFERLVTVTCRKQAHEAIKYEGPAAMESSFGVLGEVAMKGLMSHPEVGEGFQEFSNFVDNEKIRRLVEEPGE